MDEIRTSNLSNQVPDSTQHQRTMIPSHFNYTWYFLGQILQKIQSQETKRNILSKVPCLLGKKVFVKF